MLVPETKVGSFVDRGRLLLSEKPFVHVIDAELRHDLCDFCAHKGKLLKCTGCAYVYYCERTCQRNAWKYHKFECSSLKQIYPRVLPSAVHMVSRLIIKLTNGGDCVKEYYAPNKFRFFKDLMSHYAEIKNDPKRQEHFISICGVLNDYLKGVQLPNSSELLGIFGRMCINSFQIINNDVQKIGTALYLACSIVDHTCRPNATAVFEGTTINIRTIEPIDKFDWSKVRISYVELLNMRETRQKELLDGYYFLCDCQRCLSESDDATWLGALCPSGKNCLIPMCGDSKIQDVQVLIKCPECKCEVNREFIERFYEALEFTNGHLKTMDDHSRAYLDICRLCLEKQEGIFHSTNIYHVKILDAAFESCIDLGLWNEAIKYGRQLVPGFRHYYGEYHVNVGILYMKIAKLLRYMNEDDEAERFRNLGKDVTRITHGTSHSLYRNHFLSPKSLRRVRFIDC